MIFDLFQYLLQTICCSPVVQDAKKGVLFDSFPPVLQLHLKRFEYDFQRDVSTKVWLVHSELCICLTQCHD